MDRVPTSRGDSPRRRDSAVWVLVHDDRVRRNVLGVRDFGRRVVLGGLGTLVTIPQAYLSSVRSLREGGLV